MSPDCVSLDVDNGLNRSPTEVFIFKAVGEASGAFSLSPVFYDQWVDDFTAMNATEDEERSLLGIDQFFIH